MSNIKPKLSSVDPVWSRVCEEAVEAIKEEPLLGGLIHSSLLHHARMEQALAYRFSLKLASGEMSEQILREIADEAYATDPDLAQSARADLMAVFERDPACHRFLQPILFFKGFQAVQAYRVGHWLWKSGRTDLAYFVQMRVSEVFGVDIHPAAIREQYPTWMFPNTFAPAPIITPLPIFGCRSPSSLPVPPSVTECSIDTLSPTTAVSPMTIECA